MKKKARDGHGYGDGGLLEKNYETRGGDVVNSEYSHYSRERIEGAHDEELIFGNIELFLGDYVFGKVAHGDDVCEANGQIDHSG